MSFSLFLTTVSGTPDPVSANASVTYTVDWGVMPTYEGQYELSFAFISQGIAGTTDAVFFPTVVWGAIPKTYSTFNPLSIGGTVIQSYGNFTTNSLGFVRATALGIAPNGQFTSDRNQNVPIILSKKPIQNQFTVRLLAPDGTLYPFGAIGYVLSIHFKAI